MPSSFFTPGAIAKPEDLAILHVRRDQLTATILGTHDDEGYDEGKVTNTRFGSYPHSTLIGKPWGSQVVASQVDTGSRGRRHQNRQSSSSFQKRKADEAGMVSEDSATATTTTPPLLNLAEQKKQQLKTAVSASSGFIHLLPPTPESWTASLPHRTQVVYTPDYSYILHRLRVRPGSTIIEAGAGSGSFTHAAARAVFNGYPGSETLSERRISKPRRRRRHGKVCSFEFHAQRVERIKEEIRQHGLDGIVRITHRDVYNDGFLLQDTDAGCSTESLKGRRTPKATAIFLDLPAPWLALKHLVRDPPDTIPEDRRSPMDPESPVYICTFSPCIEQAQKTISVLRQHSWLFIEMVEVAHRRIEVRREKYGFESKGGNGEAGTDSPKNIAEAVAKIRVIEERQAQFRKQQIEQRKQTASHASVGVDNVDSMPAGKEPEQVNDEKRNNINNHYNNDIKQEDNGMNNEVLKHMNPTPHSNKSNLQTRKIIPPYEQGRLYHRTESDIRSHTSYLVFAILPVTWTPEDDFRAQSTAERSIKKATG